MKKSMSIVFILLFLLCIGIMDYPFLARIYNERVQAEVISSYQKNAEGLAQDTNAKLKAAAEQYNRELFGAVDYEPQDAFGTALNEKSEYEELLNTDESGVMAVISIPALRLKLPVYHGTSEAVLQKGAGHLQGSSLPIGGRDTHTCISAHRGLPNKKMFTNLDLLEEGDIFYLRVLDETLAYEVYGIETVTPDQTEALKIQKGEDLATLITCTPYGINTHRLYIHGRRIPYEEKELQEKEKTVSVPLWKLYWWVIATVALLIWMIILLCYFNRRGETE